MSRRSYLIVIISLLVGIFAILSSPIPVYLVPGSECSSFSNCNWSAGQLTFEPSLFARLYLSTQNSSSNSIPIKTPPALKGTTQSVKVPGPVPLDSSIQNFPKSTETELTPSPRIIPMDELEGSL